MSASATVNAVGVTLTPRASSSVIVPLAAPAPSAVETVAFVGVSSVTVIVSFSSSTSSPATGIAMFACLVPAKIVTERGSGSV